MSDELAMSSMGTLMQLSAAEIDTQIATARRFRRDLALFQKNVELQVTASPEIAISMSYKLERKSKDSNEINEIVGPSVRFAEVAAINFGNMRVGARIVDIDENFVTAQGMAWDLENNFAAFRERKGSIRTSKGFKYSQDMIKTVANAQSSIAYREAILKTVPQALWKPLWDKSRQFLIEQKAEDITPIRDKAIAYFVKRGVTVEKILAKLGRASVENITPEDMVILGAIYTSVKDEGAHPQEEFKVESAEKEEPSKVAELLNKMKKESDKTPPPVI